MKFLRYDVIGSSYAGIDEHPQTQMKNLGFKLIHSVPQSIADCWWFCVEDYDNIELPNYIHPMNPYNLKYWKDKCWQTCPYFKKSFDTDTQTRHNEFSCYGGIECKYETK